MECDMTPYVITTIITMTNDTRNCENSVFLKFDKLPSLQFPKLMVLIVFVIRRWHLVEELMWNSTVVLTIQNKATKSCKPRVKAILSSFIRMKVAFTRLPLKDNDTHVE